MMEVNSNRVLTLLRLVMINIIAVDSLRNLSLTAQAGWMAISFYIIAGVLFLLPLALIVSELATAWPKTGGIYLWTKQAFGAKFGFIILFLQWVYNLVWFPSICGFIAGIIAYLVAPGLHISALSLVDNPYYMIAMSLVMYWIATLVSLFGLKISSTVSLLGAILGTLIPMLIIIILALVWWLNGYPVAHPPTLAQSLPSMTNINHWAVFLTVMFSLLGLEMSAIHAGNVKNPKKNFPRAMVISALVIVLSLILANCALLVVSSNLDHSVDSVAGLIESFSYFFTQFHLGWMRYVVAASLILGAFSTMSTWIMGLSRGFLVAGEDKLLPNVLVKCNRHQAPSRILITQGIIFSILCLSYIVLPSVHSAYWYLSALTAQLALIAYIGMFLAAIKLKLNDQIKPNQFVIPGGSASTIALASVALIICIISIIVGFIPTPDVLMPNSNFIELLLAGILIALIIPYIWTKLIKTEG
ncbi:APC family permease [Thiotrichales bacterium 19S3-7]|nr:APC family permease [Thiotrichales bacterium 19S3-7]MCF6801650.1 APC family permease [Thiotrichales bacterium 19S3-11]